MEREDAGGRRPMVPWCLVVAVAAISLVVVIPVPPTPAGAATDDQPAPPVDAEVLYGRDCVSCHGPAGEGSWRGPSLLDAGEASAYYMLATGRMPIDEPRRSIERGEPAYDADEIDALVDYVAGLGPGGVDLPDVDPSAGAVAEGGVLFRRHCSGCHGATGVGGSLAFDVVAPPVLRSSVPVVAAAVVHGPGAMPAFDERLTDEELDSLVAYVEQMGDPVDDGGHPLARSGRVDEAVMGWGVSLGALVLAGAWLARRPR